MPYLSGVDRRERLMLPECFDDYVEATNEVRVIDLFVERLTPAALPGAKVGSAATGRPAYAPRDLLKLFVWGYVNRVTSSRRLERECGRNLEVIWLLRRLRPDHWTICAFRRGAEATLRGLLREFVRFARELSLMGAELVAIDGTKLKAVNNVTQQRTAAQLAKEEAELEEQIEAYLRGTEQADAQAEAATAQAPMVPLAESAPTAEGVPLAENAPLAASAPLAESASSVENTPTAQSAPASVAPERPVLTAETLPLAQAQLAQCRERQQALEQSGRESLTLTDPDSRRLRKVGVGYNGQIAVDSLHHLIVAAEIVDAGSDYQQLLPMAQAAREALELRIDETLKLTADGGFYDRQMLYATAQAGFESYVPRPKQKGADHDSEGPGTGAYAKSAFSYDAVSDTYTCPQGQRLAQTRSAQKRGLRLHYYSHAAACAACPVRARCSKGAAREVERWEHEAFLEQLEARQQAHPEMMVRRKALVEHPFGTIKFWNHQSAFLTRGFSGVQTEFLLSALAYNLKRLLKLVALPELLRRLETRPQPRTAATAPGAATAATGATAFGAPTESTAVGRAPKGRPSLLQTLTSAAQRLFWPRRLFSRDLARRLTWRPSQLAALA